MSIFAISNSKLQPVSEKKFDLERDIQKLTEANLETVFGLKFISGATNQEFSLRVQEQDFYIDTLAFDEAQKCFVIIEYKKDKSISVIDQGFAYLSAMLNHKADVILEINEKWKKNYTKKDINWDLSRVIFVSPEFTNYQKNAINFKDLPIYLYEVKIYDNNIIEFDPIKPYRTSESIGTLSKDKTIQNVSREVKVYSEDDVIGNNEDRVSLYALLKEKLLAVNSSLIFHPTRSYIGVQKEGDWRNFIGIETHQNGLRIFYTRSQPQDFTDPKKKLFYRENSFKNYNQHMSGLLINSSEDVDYAVSLFEQLFERLTKVSNG